ncbi:3'-5' ssDNA/RNA exonuclease TatD [Candidatus Erwinia haradaeae]|uniref:3'-5' ssDNA/RNA exonuclease TatD n=1 Tax=Candidatus Erwinia haradaeae TaxID=1922217 RepID=A0A451DCR5_9GAMM|nr:TatD family hydrolase [Candidatus Erwinia haradaeae]VFP84251.1 3'-5' ssDNA/RNA exonuclease TatD [Candidatus Erwinia haradaeae]
MFDVGVNLTSKKFLKDREKVVQRARAVGVTGMVIISCTLSDSRQAIMLAKEGENYFWCTVGVHPNYANTWSQKVGVDMRPLIYEPCVVAIGECGLDFHRSFATKKKQIDAFQAQIELAVELSVPLFLHCRNAHKCLMSILKPWLPHLPSVFLHCFTGTQVELEVYIEHGIFIGVTGWICDVYRGRDLRQLISLIPSDLLLIETDAPWLLPMGMDLAPPSKRNEPCFLPHIIQTVAILRGDDMIELSKKITLNAHKLFHLI